MDFTMFPTLLSRLYGKILPRNLTGALYGTSICKNEKQKDTPIAYFCFLSTSDDHLHHFHDLSFEISRGRRVFIEMILIKAADKAIIEQLLRKFKFVPISKTLYELTLVQE